MAYIRHSRPDSGLGFQVKVLQIFLVVPFSLDSGMGASTVLGCSLAIDAVRSFSGRVRAKRDNVKGFDNFHPKATARIWSSMSYLCRICSTAVAHVGFHQRRDVARGRVSRVFKMFSLNMVQDTARV